MNRHAILGLVALLLFPFLLVAGCDSEAAEVVATDKAYDRAIDSQNGAAAVEFLSKDSVAFLDRMVETARVEWKDQLKARPFHERYEILRARLLYKPAELKQANGRSYYTRLVDEGWVWSTSEARRTKVAVANSKARATITYKYRGDRETFRGYWVFEDGKWKEDLVLDGGEIDQFAREQSARERISEDQLLVRMLEDETERDVPDSIWEAPR
ncbi:MAG: hypothetical protein IT436_08905 [Phycisphaerales bacterium]|nr:hypothetical protein [Phycisphaerales bacterium]